MSSSLYLCQGYETRASGKILNILDTKTESRALVGDGFVNPAFSLVLQSTLVDSDNGRDLLSVQILALTTVDGDPQSVMTPFGSRNHDATEVGAKIFC